MNYTDGMSTVYAQNYYDAAIKLYGQTYYSCPRAADPDHYKIPTTYVRVSRGFATVFVYNVGDKQGSSWGVQAAVPQRYRLHKKEPQKESEKDVNLFCSDFTEHQYNGKRYFK